jgi:hypothetical protein
MSAAGVRIAVPPALAMTLRARLLPMRILSPLKSLIVLIFFRNHPAICGANAGPGRGTRLKAA